MSGIVQNNILRSSGTVAVSAAGLNWSDTIITGSTVTVEAVTTSCQLKPPAAAATVPDEPKTLLFTAPLMIYL